MTSAKKSCEPSELGVKPMGPEAEAEVPVPSIAAVNPLPTQGVMMQRPLPVDDGVGDGSAESTALGVVDDEGDGEVLELAPGDIVGVDVGVRLALGQRTARIALLLESAMYMAPPNVCGRMVTLRGWLSVAAPFRNPSMTGVAMPLPTTVATTPFDGVSLRMRLLFMSVTKTAPVGSRATAVGELNKAAGPTPSSIPDVAPAIVRTRLDALVCITRILLLPVSATKTLPLLGSKTTPCGLKNVADTPIASVDPATPFPATVKIDRAAIDM